METTRDVEGVTTEDLIAELRTTATKVSRGLKEPWLKTYLRDAAARLESQDAEIRRLRSEVGQANGSLARAERRFAEMEAELGRKGAALRDLADEWEEDAADLLSVPPCGAVEIAIAGTMQASANDLRALATGGDDG